MATTEDIINMLGAMEKLESAISGFYTICSENWPEHKEFWDNLARAEIRHSGHLLKMIEFVRRNPGAYAPGRSFLQKAVETVTSGIAESTKRAENGELTMRTALFIARDIEQSLIEKNYPEGIRTENAGFKELLGRIVADTNDHNAWLQAKIREISSGGGPK